MSTITKNQENLTEDTLVSSAGNVTVIEVTSKKDLWKWVRFPNKLYKDNAFFVPFLENDEFDNFSGSVEKNPVYEFCQTKLFLAYKNGELVGRICC